MSKFNAARDVTVHYLRQTGGLEKNLDDGMMSLELRFLVVVGDTVVAEDLREFLSMYPQTRVDVRKMSDTNWSDNYTMAFFGVSLDQMLHDERVREMHRAGTQLVVLSDQIPKSVFDGTSIMALPRPFNSEDIAAIVNSVGIEKRNIF